MDTFVPNTAPGVKGVILRVAAVGGLFMVPFRRRPMNLAPERGRYYLCFRVFLNNPRPASPDASSANEAGSGTPAGAFGV